MCGSVIRGRARCSYDVLSTLTRRHTSHSSLTLFLAHVNVATRDDWIGCKGGTLRSSDDCGRSAADEASPTAAAVASTLLPNRFFTGAELAAPPSAPVLGGVLGGGAPSELCVVSDLGVGLGAKCGRGVAS